MSDRYVCCDAALERDEPMFATGSWVRGWLLVEVRGAWGQDAIHDSALGEHVPSDWKDQLQRRHIRAVCIRSHADGDGDSVRLFTCVPGRPGAPPGPLWRRTVRSLADVAAAVDDVDVHRPPGVEWEPVTEQQLLVCTNGRHDQCCANLGRPLVRALRESKWAGQLWECSHIGGDRFAANLVVLPDSLYFGRVDPESAPQLLDRLDAGQIDISKFRGRTTYSLAEQAVEHFVRTELAIDAVDGVVIGRRSDDGAYAVRLPDRRVHVRVSRRMVSVTEPLTCRGQPNQLVPVFTLESITEAS